MILLRNNKYFCFLLLQKCTTGVRTQYAQNPKSMHKSEYESVFFVCRKPGATENTHTEKVPEQSHNGFNHNNMQE